jgi:hypothetical protein
MYMSGVANCVRCAVLLLASAASSFPQSTDRLHAFFKQNIGLNDVTALIFRPKLNDLGPPRGSGQTKVWMPSRGRLRSGGAGSCALQQQLPFAGIPRERYGSLELRAGFFEAAKLPE